MCFYLLQKWLLEGLPRIWKQITCTLSDTWEMEDAEIVILWNYPLPPLIPLVATCPLWWVVRDSEYSVVLVELSSGKFERRKRD